MKNVSMMPVMMPRIGVDTEGNPVVYDPEKAAAKRAEIVAEIREKNGIPDDKFITVSFTPELERGYVRSPEKDTVEIGASKDIAKFPNQDMIGAMKIPPKVQDALEDVLAEAVKKYGSKFLEYLLLDLIVDKLLNSNQEPESNAEEVAQTQPRFEEVA